MKKYLSLFLVIILFSCSTDQDDNIIDLDDNTIDQNTTYEVIDPDSELFDWLKNVSQDDSESLKDIACIDFIYPINIFTLDQNSEPTGQITITNNTSFISFLSNINEDTFISISYPIVGIYEDGSQVNVNNNEQLLQAIESCGIDELILNCSGIPDCSLTIPYFEGYDNTFAGSSFDLENDGTIQFDYLDRTYNGTLNFLNIENELFVNIFLVQGDEEEDLSPFWNFNFKLEIVNNQTFVISTDDFSRVLYLNCSISDELNIGDLGPYGGTIAHKKEFFTKGWSYISAKTLETNEEWGCYDSLIEEASYSEIGFGLTNTLSILNFHNNLDGDFETNPEICSDLSNGTLAAKTALMLESEDQTLFNANQFWFMPSIADLQAIYDDAQVNNNLFEEGIYWSSTQSDELNVKCFDFATGQIIDIPKNSSDIKTMVVRYF